MPRIRKAAFLDLDDTLCTGAASAHQLRHLRTTPGVNTQALEAAIQGATRNEKNGPSPLRGTVYANYPAAVDGIPYTAVLEAAHRALPDAKATLMPFAKDLTKLLHERGYTVIVISGALQEITTLIATDLNADLAIGAEIARHPSLDSASGICLPELRRAPARRGAKQDAVLRLADIYGYDLARSFGMGNGVRDAEILANVGKAMAFEPDAELMDLAADNNWAVADRHTIMQACTVML